MQKVELYFDALEAKRRMEDNISGGWRVHTCTMGCYMAGFEPCTKVLVIYEKN